MSELIDGQEVTGHVDLTELVTFEKGAEVSSGYGYTIDGDNAIRFPVDNTNIAVGALAGDVLESPANSNVAIGYNTCLFNETGSFNTLVGREAGRGVTGNSFAANTFIGYKAGYFTTTGGQNTFLGYQAGCIHNTGADNVLLGYQAGYFNETGDNNVVVGKDAGFGATGQSYSNNVFVGYQAGYSTTTGDSNVSMGSLAGYYNQTGQYNVCIGRQAGQGATGQSYNSNVFVGYQAGFEITTGTNNVLLGHQAGYDITTGNSNICFGYRVGFTLTEGDRNVFIGYAAGYSVETGDGNVCIGYQAGYNETGSDRLYIDNSNTTTPLIYGEFDNRLIRINGDLEVTGSFPALTNLLTNAGFGVWSNSTLEGPDRENDLVTNGGFDSDATGWTAQNCTLASIAGGQSGNCLEMTRTADSYQRAYQIFATEIGKLYKVTAYVKSGTSGNEGFTLRASDSGAATIQEVTGTSSGSWVQYEVIFEATTTTSRIMLQKNTATAGTMLFDTAECYAIADQLVTNGGFDSDTTDWTAINSSIASIGGGQLGNCLEITKTAETSGSANQVITTEVGKLYRATVYVKSGTSGNESFVFQALDPTWTPVLGGYIGTSSGSWVKYEFTFEANDTTAVIVMYKNSATAGTMLFDTVTCHEATPGCVVDDALGPDGWNKFEDSAHANIYREHNGSNTKDGEFYSLKFVSTESNEAHTIAWPSPSTAPFNTEWMAKFKNRVVTLGCWVKADTIGIAQVGFYDNAYRLSSANTTTDWEWLEHTITVSSALSQFSVRLHINTTDKTAYFSQPMLVFGKSIGEGNYVPQVGETIPLEALLTLTDYSGATISANATINLEAQSDGKIPKGIKGLYVTFFGSCATVTKWLGLKDVRIYSQVADKLAAGTGLSFCDSNGDLSMARNDTFDTVYIDPFAVQLR